MVDIHGQFETYGLLNPSTHRSVLDQFSGHPDLLSKVSDLFYHWKDEEGALSSAREAAMQSIRHEEYIRACSEELRALEPLAGEEIDLLDQREKDFRILMRFESAFHLSLIFSVARPELICKSVSRAGCLIAI